MTGGATPGGGEDWSAGVCDETGEAVKASGSITRAARIRHVIELINNLDEKTFILITHILTPQTPAARPEKIRD
jgi:hypothetical protein